MMNLKEINAEKEIGSSNKLIPCYPDRIERTKKMNMNQSFLINKNNYNQQNLYIRKAG